MWEALARKSGWSRMVWGTHKRLGMAEESTMALGAALGQLGE